MDVPYVPRHLVPGEANGIPLPPHFREREDWLWRHARSAAVRAFLAPIRGGAIQLVASSSEDVYWSSSPVTALPVSFGAWAYADTTPTSAVVMSIGQAAGNNYYSIRYRAEGVNSFNFQSWNGTSTTDANASAAISTATWYSVLAAAASATDRDIWVDGANIGSDTANDGVTYANWDQVKVGRHSFTGSNHPWDGRVAEAFIYAADDDATMAAQFAAGAHPLLVNIDALRFYAPLVRDETAGQWHELFSAGSSTESATPTVADHVPTVYRAAPPLIVPFSGIQTIRPNSTVSAGNWTAVGAASLHAATNDDSDASYANLNEGDDPSAMELGLQTLQRPGSGTGTITIRERHA